MSQQVFEQAFAVASPARLSLRNIRGQVTMRPAKDGQLAVKAIKHTASGDAERTEVEMWQSDEGNVFIATRFRQGHGGRPCRVDYEVHVPAPCTIALRSVSGSVLLEQLEGRFRVKMVSGQLHLDELQGRLKVRTVSGDITAMELAGRLQLETVSGNVRIQSSRLAAVRAKTVNGNLSLETPLQEGPYRLETVSGQMRLLVPPGTSCQVAMHSLSGRLRLDGEERRASPFARRQQIRLGQGGPLVRFHSVSGDLAVDPTGALKSASSGPPLPPAPEKPLAGM
jgi:hypothetical protein